MSPRSEANTALELERLLTLVIHRLPVARSLLRRHSSHYQTKGAHQPNTAS